MGMTESDERRVVFRVLTSALRVQICSLCESRQETIDANKDALFARKGKAYVSLRTDNDQFVRGHNLSLIQNFLSAGDKCLERNFKRSRLSRPTVSSPTDLLIAGGIASEGKTMFVRDDGATRHKRTTTCASSG